MQRACSCIIAHISVPNDANRPSPSMIHMLQPYPVVLLKNKIHPMGHQRTVSITLADPDAGSWA